MVVGGSVVVGGRVVVGRGVVVDMLEEVVADGEDAQLQLVPIIAAMIVTANPKPRIEILRLMVIVSSLSL